MKRMSGVDAFMLGMETSRAYMHTYKVAILDPSTDPEGWSFDRYYQLFSDRIHLAPMLRWKMAPSPLGINHPYWVEDPDFNLHYHVRRVACPPPADHRALCEFMSAIYAYKLDRDRPLWMQWIVEGLADGKVALVMVVHHAYVDGVGAAWLMKQIYQPLSEPVAAPPVWNPPPYPSWWRRLGYALRDWPEVMLGNLPRVVSGLVRKRRMDRARQLEGRPPHPAPGMMRKTPINVALSPGRTFVCDVLPLEKFKRISKCMGVTINDVFGTCASGAVRHLLIDLGYDADAHPLIAGTPFAGERPAGMEGLGNFATADFCWFRSDVADPKQRLQATHEANAEMKAHLAETKAAGADISAVIQILPPWVATLLSRVIQSKGGRVGFFGNVALSNVPGPKDPLFLGPWKLHSWFSTGQIFDGTALNMTMWSYAGNANLCILTDREVLADGWVLFNYFVQELDALDALANDTPAPEASPQETRP